MSSQSAFSVLGAKKTRWIDVIILAAIFCFLLCYFEPHLLLSPTITTGGDTASHYYTAKYLRDYLLPHGRVSGWCQGNLAGFPILQNYFPLPFLLMAFLSWVIPLQIAFKLITVLGTFLLPPATYLFFRCLKHPFPVPAMGAVFTLPFLFMQGNSMWGGNIPSTLAGTFCYSLGFALAILWLGLLYRSITEKRGLLGCALLLAMVGMCHGYALLFGVFTSFFFIFTRSEIAHNLRKLLYIHLLAFCLMAFWLVPLIVFLPYTTRFSILWIFFDLKQIGKEVFPVILYPFIGLGLSAFIWACIKRRRPLHTMLMRPWVYLWYSALCAIILYWIGYKIGVVDIRFLPFLQFFLVISGAMAFYWITSHKKIAVLTALMALLLTCLWIDNQETFIGDWIRSNYKGFENRRLWKPFISVNRFLKGTPDDSRVAYEHSMVHQGAGTVRAFESLPLFSGRSTLEGVYIQGSLNVPFIFYIQSEISQKASMPIPHYNYSRFNLSKAVQHLELFNVRELIAAESETQEALKIASQFRFRYAAGPYQVFELKSDKGQYVVPLKYKPVLITQGDWRRISYKWFRLGDLAVPLVFKDRLEQGDSSKFLIKSERDILKIHREPLGETSAISEIVQEEKITIEGASPGEPLMVKISYHPNWQVDGADRIYLVSPAFMLIYPQSSTVTLYYGRTWPDYLGAILTGLGLLYILLSRFLDLSHVEMRVSAWFDRYCLKAFLLLMVVALLVGGFFLIRLSPEFPVITFNKGIGAFTRGNYATARMYFEEVLERFPQTLIVDQAGYHHAMCFYREQKWDQAITSLKWLMTHYPETGRAGEAYYHMGLCYLNLGKIDEAREYFMRTMTQFPDEDWARFSRDRLMELKGS
ncbi:MAG: 6-pyruvoyl-tetrahydropterin synthase-related protein [Deltaproteobacteria bacterium]|nr:6-pyruvoyl-tetrahydropterin synthase-related protein [Deltaproteobacteria bacterium]